MGDFLTVAEFIQTFGDLLCLRTKEISPRIPPSLFELLFIGCNNSLFNRAIGRLDMREHIRASAAQHHQVLPQRTSRVRQIQVQASLPLGSN